MPRLILPWVSLHFTREKEVEKGIRFIFRSAALATARQLSRLELFSWDGHAAGRRPCGPDMASISAWNREWQKRGQVHFFCAVLW